jgi:RNA polymerase sigma-70 factor (ECF subfamily)
MDPTTDYIQQLIRLQPQLHAYILALVFNRSAADDVLQNTNLVLCRKSAAYDATRSFRGWAFSIARLECLKYWKSKPHESFVLTEELLDALADRTLETITFPEDLGPVLRECLASLQPRQRQLLETRYHKDRSIREIADDLGRPESSISQTLYRLRRTLSDCIRSRLAKLEGAFTKGHHT